MPTDSTIADCATDEMLERLAAHELSASDEQSLRRHVDSCSSCAARVSRLADTHNEWIVRLRSVGAPPAGAHVSDRSAAIVAPDAIAGYRIDGEIARGGQGVVFRAEQLATRRIVALKVLRDGALASDNSRRRFQREIELIAELRHPNLLTVFDAGITRDGRAFFAMEFIEGMPLGRWIQAQATPVAASSTPRQRSRPVLAAFVKICSAVAYAHQRGAIHRDLKPSNVLVDAAGEPRVVDFGLARWIAADEGPGVTSAGQIAGTLPYLSPEQARGLPDAVDVRSDVYSLGVMLYEAFTAAYPYPIEPDTVATLRHIAETAPTPPRRRTAVRSLVDDELETIILKALAKERDRRYQSAAELARDLERYLAGEPIDAKRDSAAYVLRKALRRHCGIVTLSAAFVASVMILAAALAVLYARQTHLRSVAEERFQQVRQLAKTFIFDFDPRIRRLPGSAEARQLIVEKGLAYLDLLASEAPDDPVLRRELAAGYMTIGDIQADATTSNLGRTSEAIVSYRKAIELLERAGAAFGSDDENRGALILARLRLGDALLGQRAFDEVQSLYESALALCDAALRGAPDSDSLADNRADALERLGNLHGARGDRARAADYYEQAATISEQRAAAQPDNLDRQRDLAVSYTKRAHSHYADGDLPGAAELYRKYVAIMDRLRQSRPEDVVSLRDAAVGYQWLGILELESGRPQQALDPLSTSRDLLERLVAADASNSDAGLILAATLTRLCEAQIAVGRFDDAGASAERNREISRAVVERSPDAPGAGRQYGVALYKLFEHRQALAQRAADGELRRRLSSEACEWLQECLDWFAQQKRSGRLAPSDEGIPAELQRELDDCRAKLDPVPAAP